MKNNIMKIFLVIVMTFMVTPINNLSNITKVNALESTKSNIQFKVGSLKYEVTNSKNKKVKVIEYNSNATSVKIPQTVSYKGNKYKVTRIDDCAFMGCSKLTSISIPNGVKSIGLGAFRVCRNLKNITIPNSVESIEDSVFELCNNLQSIVIPNSVKNMGTDVFYGCTNLKNVKLSNKLKLIDYQTFIYCENLTSITIPNSVTSIDDYVFINCSNLKKIELPNKLKKIGSQVFFGCHKLTSITIPSSVTTIGNEAFDWCKNLTLKVYNGSYGLKYAKNNKIPYKIVKSIANTKIKVKNVTYTGKSIKPKLTVKDGNKTLKNGTDYTLNFISGKNNKNTGSAYVKITGKGKYAGNKTITYYIVPKKVTLSSVKSNAKKKITVKYKKVTGASGYQIAYQKSGSNKWFYTTVSSKNVSKTLTKLTSRKNYKVKVRAYKTVGKNKYYGTYSSIKTVKVK